MQNILKAILLFIFFIGSVILSGFTLDQKGMVLVMDDAYKATVIGTNKDGFTVPDGILWNNGKLYLADEGGSALRVWSNNNEVQTFCDASSGVISPEDLVMDGDGNIFFTDDDTGGVWKTDKYGKTTQLVGKDKGLISTEGIAISPFGTLLVGDGETHQVFSVNQNGGVSVFIGADAGIKKAESMTFDDKGNLFIADNQDNVLYLMTPDKKLHRPIENRDGFSPETIWYSKGVLYITDSQNGKLSSYTPEEGLKTIAVFGGKLASINGVTTDDKGNFYLSIQTDLKRKQGFILKLEKETPQ